jgi:hypothetical protein
MPNEIKVYSELGKERIYYVEGWKGRSGQEWQKPQELLLLLITVPQM